jgi:hypothetical protein
VGISVETDRGRAEILRCIYIRFRWKNIDTHRQRQQPTGFGLTGTAGGTHAIARYLYKPTAVLPTVVALAMESLAGRGPYSNVQDAEHLRSVRQCHPVAVQLADKSSHEHACLRWPSSECAFLFFFNLPPSAIRMNHDSPLHLTGR